MPRAIHKVKWSVVHRPNDIGIDLPAGTSASHLEPADYHPVEMGPPEPEELSAERTWFDWLLHPTRGNSR